MHALTFAVVMRVRDLQQLQGRGQPAQTVEVSVGVLDAGHHAFQDVRHAAVDAIADFLYVRVSLKTIDQVFSRYVKTNPSTKSDFRVGILGLFSPKN